MKAPTTMLAPASESLLTRFLYSLSVFGSDMLMSSLGMSPDVWSTLMLLTVFILARTVSTEAFVQWKSRKTAKACVNHEWMDLLTDIVQTFVDTNWTTILFIIVQWAIDLFKGFWVLSSSPIIGVVAMEIPVVVLTALLYSSHHDSAGLTTASQVSDNMLASINFAISFFVADVLIAQLKVAPSTWDFIWITGSFVLLRTVVNRAFSMWVQRKDTPEAAGAAALKAVLVDNVETILSIGVFMLTQLFVAIFEIWWVEGEHWIVAFAIFQTFLFGVLGFMAYMHEKATDENNVPDDMVNRALFAMSMFIAEKARAMNSVEFNELHLVILTVTFVWLHATTSNALNQWTPKTDATALGERVLKVAVAKNVLTWITIAVVFVVRLLVDVYGNWWRKEPSAIVGGVLVEGTVLLIITSVKTLVFVEERHRKAV